MENSSARPRPARRLNIETTPEHERVEAVLENRWFGSDGFDRSDFTSLLETLYGLYRPLEGRLVPAVERHLDGYSYSSRAERIASDLRLLDRSTSRLGQLPIVPSEKLVALEGTADVLGCLYVIEGSELGNRVIRRELEQHLDEESLKADSFFRRDSGETAERWEQFRALLNDRLSDESRLQAAVSSARATFQLFEDWLA